MEPALEWREHDELEKWNALGTTTPQWSPPWNGGNTPGAYSGRASSPPPQWSPPWNGGNTCCDRVDQAGLRRAAMEPALEWREHLYATASITGPGAAAMEPALEWREHLYADPRPDRHQHRRNGARLGMAGTRLAKFRPYKLRGREVVRAVGMSIALEPLYGLVKLLKKATDLHANAPWVESHHLGARSSDDECSRGR